MSASAPHEVARHCRNGLAALDHVLEHKPDHVHDTIAEATRCMVGLRDALIHARRSGSNEHESLIGHVNALLSVLVASEFPLVGVRWERLKQARDEYEALIGRAIAAGKGR